jgi:signal transduction histidine kinase
VAAETSRVEQASAAVTLSPTATRLVTAVRELSQARDLDTIMRLVRDAARELTGSDGASFVLRDRDDCYYAEESAIAPLWKGRRFPSTSCISGWVMEHGESVAIDDVFADSRVPQEVYAPTFVKSLAMVPIRHAHPLGAIGTYWKTRHCSPPEELAVLQALADSTAVAMENVAVYAELERRVEQRTLALQSANRELAAKHASLIELQQQRDTLNALVVHDLKSPASAIILAAHLRLDRSNPGDTSRRDWSRVLASAEQVHRTALDLLDVISSKEGRISPRLCEVDIGALLLETAELLGPHAEQRHKAIEIQVAPAFGVIHADPQLLRRVLQNLVDNALKHTPANGAVRVVAESTADGCIEICVSDFGPGIAVAQRQRVFSAHTTLEQSVDGTSVSHGLGLTFCRLAVEAHGGRIWIEDNDPCGSRFRFQLPPHGASSPERCDCPSFV